MRSSSSSSLRVYQFTPLNALNPLGSVVSGSSLLIKAAALKLLTLISISTPWVIKLGLTVRRRQRSYQCPCKASRYTCCQLGLPSIQGGINYGAIPALSPTTRAFGHIQHVSAIHKKAAGWGTQRRVERRRPAEEHMLPLFPPDSIRLHRPHQKKPQHSQRGLADYRLGGLTFVTTECVLVCAELSLPAPCRSHRGLEQSVCECV